MNYLTNIYNGLYEGYPLCCILEFIKTNYSEGHTLYYRERRNCICTPASFISIKDQIDNKDSMYNQCKEALSDNKLCDKLKDKIFYKTLCDCCKDGYVPCNKCHEELKKKNLIKSIPYKDAEMSAAMNPNTNTRECSNCKITPTRILFWILVLINIVVWFNVLFM